MTAPRPGALIVGSCRRGRLDHDLLLHACGGGTGYGKSKFKENAKDRPEAGEAGPVGVSNASILDSKGIKKRELYCDRMISL